VENKTVQPRRNLKPPPGQKNIKEGLEQISIFFFFVDLVNGRSTLLLELFPLLFHLYFETELITFAQEGLELRFLLLSPPE
jgi:hypothetical protein